jgi:hypothetical protein
LSDFVISACHKSRARRTGRPSGPAAEQIKQPDRNAGLDIAKHNPLARRNLLACRTVQTLLARRCCSMPPLDGTRKRMIRAARITKRPDHCAGGPAADMMALTYIPSQENER